MPAAQHAIDYVEFYTTDMVASQAFYRAAFGWEFVAYSPGYCGITRPGGDGELGGLELVDAVVPGGPTVVLYSADLQASRAAVLATGTLLTKDIYSFPGGERFEFCDPSGNRLAVWKPHEAPDK